MMNEVTREFLVKFRDYIEAAGGKIKQNTPGFLAARFSTPRHAGGFAALMADTNPRMYVEVKGSYVYLHDPATYMEMTEARTKPRKLYQHMGIAEWWLSGYGTRGKSFFMAHEKLIRTTVEKFASEFFRGSYSEVDFSWSKRSGILEVIITGTGPSAMMNMDYFIDKLEDWALDIGDQLFDGGEPKIWATWVPTDVEEVELTLMFYMRKK